MYSPKISEDIIPELYKKAKATKKPMTKVVNSLLRSQLKHDLTTKDLQVLLCGNRIKLDCGHQATPGHNFSNTIIIVSDGGGRFHTLCHECGY
jgi:hypothetical protein